MTDNNGQQQLLDPIGTLCRIIEINFKPENTKIIISNHALSIQDPQLLQWIIRKYNGHSKDNISDIFDVVVRVIYWYIMPLYKACENMHNNKKQQSFRADNNIKKNDHKNSLSDDDPSTETNKINLVNTINIASANVECSFEQNEAAEYFNCMKRLITYTCDALKMLQKTYKNGNVIMALQLYINLLNDAINGTFKKKHLPECLLQKDEGYNFLDYSKICDLWDYDKVKTICELYDRCVNEQLKKTSENTNQVNGNIEGYLLAINKILSTHEAAFRNLIQSSNSG